MRHIRLELYRLGPHGTDLSGTVRPQLFITNPSDKNPDCPGKHRTQL